MEQAIIDKDGSIRCPICGRKNGELTGNETVKNFVVQCKRKIAGKPHSFIINSDRNEV